MAKLYIITGPAGVGKSTVSKKLAGLLNKSVLIEGDEIYNQFVGGRIKPYADNAPLELFWDNCYALISNYLNNGYDVVFNYIINKAKLKQIKTKYKQYEIIFAVLMVDRSVLIERDKQRVPEGQMGERSLVLLDEFIKENFNPDNILNTVDIKIDDEAKMILNEDRFKLKRMKIEEIKTPKDVLKYMEDNICYGWLDTNNEVHINNMNNFRKMYRTASVEETIKYKVGTCIEQVYLMKTILDSLKIKNKMFCTRIYEKNDIDYSGEDEHMHCFILYFIGNKVYHIEHPNFSKVGIYEYASESEAIESINDYYLKSSNGISRPVTEFYEVCPNMSFKEFNNYINSLDKQDSKLESLK